MKVFKGLILPIIGMISFLLCSIYCFRQMGDSSKEDYYIVTLTEDNGHLDMKLIEPTVGNVTYQMFLRYYADSLGFVNNDLYFMEVPAEVHKAIRDSSVNVLRCPKKYMNKVRFYRIQPDSIKP
jgi:hypothetical protein